ncbi:MAG: hypothetical protein INF43_01165 [Alphaproteobacteria bacterium]|nr:hypothetical protein [Alphaproteobacteria bacterium]
MALTPLTRLQAAPLPSALPPLNLSLAPTEAETLAAQFRPLPPAAAGTATPTVAATVVGSTPLPAREGGGVQLTLQLPDGQTLTARSASPVPLGSVVQLLPPNAATSGNVSTPLGTPATASAVLVRAVVQPPTAAVSAPPATPPAVPSPTLPTLQLTNPSPLLAPLVVYPASTALPGPLPLQLPQPLPTAWANQPLTLTLQTPTQGVLQPAIPANLESSIPPPPRPQPIPVQLTSDLSLPLRTPIAMTIPDMQSLIRENVTQLTNPQTSTTTLAFVLPSQSLPQATLTRTVTLPQPAATPSPLLQALRLLIPADTPSGVQMARVLPAAPQTPPGLQPVLLASGQQAQLEVVEPLPTPAASRPANLAATLSPPPALSPATLAGTVLRVNIPTVGGPAQILQLHSHQPQLLPSNPGQTAAAVAPPQTPQAVLPPGSVVVGTITGQNAQGQPLLTLATPAALAGQTFALSLAEGQTSTPLAATLVVGARVQVQVSSNGAAQLLSLELPSAAARATTVATLGSRWDTLSQTFALLQNTNPTAAAQARANLPALANLLPGLMRVLEGIRTQDPAKLLGPEAARLASALGPDLTPDLQQLAQLLAKPAEDPTQWRGFIIPYLEHPDGQPQQGSFFFRRDTEDDPRGSSSTRFVAELTLSQLGPVQLDGLVTYPEIWLKLRLQRTPPAGFAEGLQAVVAPLLAGLQLTGGISTETVGTFPINPAAALRSAAETAVGISS